MTMFLGSLKFCNQMAGFLLVLGEFVSEVISARIYANDGVFMPMMKKYVCSIYISRCF